MQHLYKLGPLELAPGVLPRHALVFFYTAFIGITLNTFINFIQPYVLAEQLRVPEAQQGAVTGHLVFMSELMLLLACAVVGVLVDAIGRRAVFVFGFSLLAAGFLLYGHVTSEQQLLLLRLGMAWGVAAINVMITTLQADYPAESARGRFVGVTGFCIGLGAMFLVFVLAKLPLWYGEAIDTDTPGRYALASVAAIAALSALVCWFGVRDSRPALASEEDGFYQRLLAAATAARVNPRVGLAYACAFVARGDLIVIGVFFSLWLTQTGIAAGLESARAVALAAMYFGIVQGVALLSAPLLGILNDRMSRLDAVVAALALAAIGYGSLGMIDDPLGPLMIPAAILLGIGQMAVMQASQTLIAQEAPASRRGAVMGMFSVCGALGILFITKAGGELFDHWKPAPFVIVAGANLLLCAAALWLRRLERHSTARDASGQ